MKLSGYRRGGRHLIHNTGKHSAARGNARSGAGSSGKKARKKWSLKKRLLLIPGIIVAALAVLTVGAITYLRWAGSQQPSVQQNPMYSNPGYTVSDDEPNEQQAGQPPSVNISEDDPVEQGIRDPNKFTFLILATDDGANTDTIMVATFDSTNLTFDVVNIPRDTMANVSWFIKKANSLYPYMQARHRGETDAMDKAMEDTVNEFAKILGFRVDFWALVNLRAFVTLVNAIDGVDFFVPRNMNYDDYDQNLHIHYNRGMQHLNGQQSLEVVRFRHTYASGDIARIGVQQDFLTAAIQQILAKRNSINVTDLAKVFIRDVKTNIPLDNLIWFGRRFLQLDSGSITFQTMPGNYEDYVGVESYVTIYVDEWLKLVNSTLSPSYEDITESGVSILTRGADKRLYVTDGNRVGDASWGASSRGPSTTSSNSSGAGNPGGAPSSPAVNSENTPSGDLNNDDGDDPAAIDGGTPEDGSSASPQEGRGLPPDYDPEGTNEPQGQISSGDDGLNPQDNTYELPSQRIDPLDEDPYAGPE